MAKLHLIFLISHSIINFQVKPLKLSSGGKCQLSCLNGEKYRLSCHDRYRYWLNEGML